MRDVFPALTLLQRRAYQRRFMRHFYGQDTPVRATFIGANHPPVSQSYSLGDPGWTVRVLPVVRIPSRAEVRLACPPAVKALIGTVVDGSLFNPGAFEDLDVLKANEEDEGDASE